MGDSEGHDAPQVDLEAFGRTFRGLDSSHAEDLVTLEKEGAVYSEFWNDAAHAFGYYRVRLLPKEIVQYVDGAVAYEEFQEARKAGCDFDVAVERVTDPRLRRLVRSYDGCAEVDGERVDIRGCLASFLPADLEDLLCGGRPDRYERLPDLGDDRSRLAIIKAACGNFPTVAARLAVRGRGRPPVLVESEYDVQDLLWATLRPLFADLRYEDPSPKLAGRSKRIDFVIPSLSLVVEIKMVRDARHAASVAEELMIDIESYHSHPHCGHLLAFVYDPGRHIADEEQLENELGGLRVKASHQFEVEVMVRG